MNKEEQLKQLLEVFEDMPLEQFKHTIGHAITTAPTYEVVTNHLFIFHELAKLNCKPPKT